MNRQETQDISELYSAWSSGSLDPALSLLIGTQSALRPDVAEVLSEADMIAGAMLDQEQPATLADGALAATLAVIDELAPAADVRKPALLASTALNELLDLPEPLRGVAIEATGGQGWQRTSAGIQRLILDVDGTEAELYRLEPGVAVPRHSHEGAEYTLCVTGEFTDETGTYRPGDISIKGSEDTHQPVAGAGGVCFTLAVRDGGLKFTGLLGLVQKLSGR